MGRGKKGRERKRECRGSGTGIVGEGMHNGMAMVEKLGSYSKVNALLASARGSGRLFSMKQRVSE